MREVDTGEEGSRAGGLPAERPEGATAFSALFLALPHSHPPGLTSPGVRSANQLCGGPDRLCVSAPQATQLINHEGEVNRARYCPQNPHLLATKTVR